MSNCIISVQNLGFAFVQKVSDFGKKILVVVKGPASLGRSKNN